MNRQHQSVYRQGAMWRGRVAGVLLGGAVLAGCGGGGGNGESVTPSMPVTPPQGVMFQIPEPTPAFVSEPMRDYSPPIPRTEYSGDRVIGLLDIGRNTGTTATHVYYREGTLRPQRDAIGIGFNDAGSGGHPKAAYAVTVGEDASIVVTNSDAANVGLSGNSGDATIVNRGTIEIREGGVGIKAISRSQGNARTVNYGTIRFIGGDMSRGRLVTSSIVKDAMPRDASHIAEAINMPGGMLIAEGASNGRIDGLKGESGGKHLTRMVNYGTINLRGEASRGLSAQTVWGGTQAHNFGEVTVEGTFAFGMYVGSCAPWVVRGGCHQEDAEIIRDLEDGVPDDAHARNYRGGVIRTADPDKTDRGNAARAAHGIRLRVLNAGKGFAINEGMINTYTKQSIGMSLLGYTVREIHEVLPPDTTPHDSLYALNTGDIITLGEDAHAIEAFHYLGGAIDIINHGTLAVSGGNARGIHALAAGREIAVMNCRATWDASPFTGAPIQCARAYTGGGVTITTGERSTITARGSSSRRIGGNGIGIDANSDGGPITIHNRGAITASHIGIRADNRNRAAGRDDIRARVIAEDRFAETYSSASAAPRTNNPIRITHDGAITVTDSMDRIDRLRIGIDAVSDSEDITITSNGTITAPDIGIRATTSNAGKITIHVNGEINAKTPVVVNGGDGNEVLLPESAAANTALDRALRAFVASSENGLPAVPTAPGIGFLTADDALAVGGVSGRGIIRLDFRPPGRDDGVTGWRGTVGARFPIAAAQILPSIHFGLGEAAADARYVASRRDFRGHGVGLRIERNAAWLDLGWTQTREQTRTQIRVPGFALHWRPPASVAEHLRVGAGMSLGGARLSARWHGERWPGREPQERFAIELTLPLRF